VLSKTLPTLNPSTTQVVSPSAESVVVKELKRAFLHTCAGEFDEWLSPQGQLWGDHMTQMEERLQTTCRSLALALLEKRLCADPRSDPDRQFPCPKCERLMRTQRTQAPRHLVTSLGVVATARPYCVCDGCGFTCAPLDYALGVPAKGPTTARRELVAHAATTSRSFDKAQTTLAKQSRIKLSAEGVRGSAEAQGRQLVDDTRARVRACFENRGRTPQAPSEPLALLVITCDGGRVQTRTENKDERWKESKIGCVYDALPHPDQAARTAENYRGAHALTKTYVATMQPWDQLGEMIFVEACERGYFVAQQKLFISDAGNGPLSVHQTHFGPDAALIIDWYHGAEHVSACAKAIFPNQPALATPWFDRYKAHLWAGEVQSVIAAIETESKRVGLPPPSTPDTDPRVVLHRNVGYFTTHQAAMDYPTYRAKGWPISSGVAEGSVKQLGLRVKGSEQFWNLWGAEEMLALCALQASEDGRWDRYWKAQATPPPDASIF